MRLPKPLVQLVPSVKPTPKTNALPTYSYLHTDIHPYYIRHTLGLNHENQSSGLFLNRPLTRQRACTRAKYVPRFLAWY